ncbi:MAG: glycoside hydrolase family 3 protein [Bacteroidales bacterium]|nr:glycoside hydrolase family 3 protein [Bacteroidales bacterium]
MKRFLAATLILLLSFGLNAREAKRLDGRHNGTDEITRLVKRMTLKEKVCQMFIVRPESLVCPQDPLSLDLTEFNSDMADFFSEYPVGGFCIFPKNIVSPEQLSKFTGGLRSLSYRSGARSLPFRPLLCIDEEGGRVARIANTDSFGLKKFESMTALAADNDEEKIYDASFYIGSYVKEYGFDIDFAPVADVNTNPDNIIIGPRAFSDNPETAARMVTSYLSGLSDAGIKGCIKHFPGHGDTRNDTHLGYAASNKTWDEIDACEMVPFKAGIAAGVQLIMIAHIAAPNVTGTDLPSTLSSVILQEKLRGELGYKGLIITDAMEMGAITLKYGPAEAAVASVKAGTDIILLPADLKKAVDGIVRAVRKGEISEKRIDESVCRILSFKHKL